MKSAIFAMLLLTSLALPANAADYQLGALKIAHPWARATPNGAKTAAGYLVITNTGSSADRLLGATMAAAERGEVHQMTTENGVMKMRAVGGGLEIKPGETIELRPNGLHLMFNGLKHPLVQGQNVKATLKFARAGNLDVEFAVEPAGSSHSQGMHHMQAGQTQ